MSAPASSSRRAASTCPERAAAISGVSPSGFLPFGSAPASSSASMIGAAPMIAASDSANAPNMLRASTSAPASIRRLTSSASPWYAAHISAVEPSGPRAFGSAPAARSSSAASRSPASAAASSGGCSARPTGLTSVTAAAATSAHTKRIFIGRPPDALRSRLHLGERSAAVADRLDGNVGPMQHGQQQIREPRILRVNQVLTALDLAVRVTEDRRRQRIVVVPVAVAHVAAEHDDRVIEHRAVALLRVHEPVDEAGEKLRVILLNHGEPIELRRIVAVVRERVERLRD